MYKLNITVLKLYGNFLMLKSITDLDIHIVYNYFCRHSQLAFECSRTGFDHSNMADDLCIVAHRKAILWIYILHIAFWDFFICQVQTFRKESCTLVLLIRVLNQIPNPKYKQHFAL